MKNYKKCIKLLFLAVFINSFNIYTTINGFLQKAVENSSIRFKLKLGNINQGCF